ncbi:MAG: NAD(P)/FAD-dependent oxidoreductase [Candidatus Aenigmarchaeota archaeon]|nr:NAD(P)/FAD-dependent oxidoreductase [Candidatus Aenigmarchaeota archaeon]
MKIAIIGGGTIGLYTGWKLTKKGENVTIFERQTHGKHICSGLVSKRIWDYIPKNKSLIENEFDCINIHFPKKTIILDVEPDLIVVNRKKLNQYVKNLAKKAGVKFVKKEVKSIDKLKGFDFIVGAYGASSRFSIPETRLAIYIRKKGKKKSNQINIKPLKNGFAWEFPRANEIEYGVIEEINTAKKYFDKVHKIQGKICAAKIPIGLYVSDKIALVGDAAGLCKVHSGGGLIWGLESANILLRTYPDLKKYNKELRKFFEPKIFLSKMIMKIGMFMGYHLPFLVPKRIIFDNDWIF